MAAQATTKPFAHRVADVERIATNVRPSTGRYDPDSQVWEDAFISPEDKGCGTTKTNTKVTSHRQTGASGMDTTYESSDSD